MSGIKLVLTDFDGTVVQFGKHLVSEKVREAVIACENQGIRMVPVTGRYHAMAQPVLEILGFEGLGVFDNGATIQNAKTGEIVWSQWLDAATVRQVAAIIVPAARIIDYTPDHNEHEPADNELARIEQAVEPTSHVFALVKRDAVDDITKKLAAIPGTTFYTAASVHEDLPDCIGIQVNHVMADKFHGVNALRKIVEISKEYTLAIGDGDNDLPLFENAALKIAMGNATDLLKAKADHVVAPVEDDGFAEAMHRFVLNP